MKMNFISYYCLLCKHYRQRSINEILQDSRFQNDIYFKINCSSYLVEDRSRFRSSKNSAQQGMHRINSETASNVSFSKTRRCRGIAFCGYRSGKTSFQCGRALDGVGWKRQQSSWSVAVVSAALVVR